MNEHGPAAELPPDEAGEPIEFSDAFSDVVNDLEETLLDSDNVSDVQRVSQNERSAIFGFTANGVGCSLSVNVTE